MTTAALVQLVALMAALVLPIAAVMRRRRLGNQTGRLILLWIGIIGVAWLAASAAPILARYFT